MLITFRKNLLSLSSVFFPEDAGTLFLNLIANSHLKCKGKGKGKGKGKTIPVQVWTGPEGSRRLRLPHFKIFGT
jgi:hypothetical protein